MSLEPRTKQVTVKPEEFIFGLDSYKVTKKSFKALFSFIDSQNLSSREAINLVINLENPIVEENDYIPRIIPVTNKLDKLSNRSILLITKDPSIPYKEKLSEKGSPTEDVFNQIIALKRLKKLSHNHKEMTKLNKEYDLIVCDFRIQKFMPQILGVNFMKGSSKKIPFIIQMAKLDPDLKLVKINKSHKLKDERCDPDFVLRQLRSIARNASLVPSGKGTCLNIKIGYSDMSIDGLIKNIDDILKYIIDNKNTRVICGNTTRKLIKGGVNMYRDAHIKTSESISLPVYKRVDLL